MRMKEYIVNTISLSHPGLIGSQCSGAFWTHISGPALLAVALGTTAAFVTGCTSTGAGFKARLISPIPAKQQAASFESDNWYQPSVSPGFDTERFGG